MFFLNSDEIKSYVDVNVSFDFSLIKPKLNQINRDILKVHFGSTLIDNYIDIYDSANGDVNSLTTPQKKLIEKFRLITAPLAVALWVTPGQVQIDSAGIFIASNEYRKTAFEWQIKDLIKSYLKPGYQAIEDAIEFILKNIADYNDFTTHDDYEFYQKAFIPNSRIFTKCYSPLKNSFMSFLALRSCMNSVEDFEIKKVLLPDYYQALKTKIGANSTTAKDKVVIAYIQKAMAHLTICKAINELGLQFDENGFLLTDNTRRTNVGDSVKSAEGENVSRASYHLQKSGDSYLNELKAYLESNKNDFPEYVNDPLYVSPSSNAVTNEDNQNYFIAM
jgi:hypothetical protein